MAEYAADGGSSIMKGEIAEEASSTILFDKWHPTLNWSMEERSPPKEGSYSLELILQYL